VAAGVEVGTNDVLVMVSVWVQVTVVEAALEVDLEVGGGVVVLFELDPQWDEVGGGVELFDVVTAWDEEDDTVLEVVDGLHLPSAAVPSPHNVEDDETGALELEREVDDIVVLLLTMGIARADPARAARTKENEACIFDDG
jgi:hypothetical protein